MKTFLPFFRRRSRSPKPFPNLTRPLNFAHRGGMECRPQNSMAAFRGAVEEGADVLEVDVRPTVEGVPVVVHDKKLDAISNGTGYVSERSLGQLKRLDFGYRFRGRDGSGFPFRGTGVKVVTLEELLSDRAGFNVNIDLKENSFSFAQRVGEVVEQCNAAQRVTLSSFHSRLIDHCAGNFPGVPFAASPREVRIMYYLSRFGLARLHRPFGGVYEIPDRWEGKAVCNPRFVRSAHAGGQEVVVWVVNDPAEMRGYLEMGVDGIVTDRPDVLCRVMAEWKKGEES